MNEIVRFYGDAREEERLFAGSGLLERERTQEILLRHLPPPPAKILDVGGGPGIYAAWLASLGYDVYLVDPVERHLAQARQYQLADVQLGDARALPCEDGFADVVLLLGPLYHLTERADRLLALSEARRALSDEGVLAAAGISRFASLLHSLVDGFVDDDAFWAILDRDLRDGQHRNETGNAHYFTTAAFHKPEELRAEVMEAGLRNVEVMAVEGPCWLAKDLDERLRDPVRNAKLHELVRRVEREPAVMGASLHLLAVGRR